MKASILAMAMVMAMAIKINGRCHHEPPIFYIDKNGVSRILARGILKLFEVK